MTTATIKGFIHANTDPFGPKFAFFMCDDMTQCGYVRVMPYSFEIEIPVDFNMVAAKVSGLESQKAKLSEEFHRRVAQINEEISKLQCLEFTPAGVA